MWVQGAVQLDLLREPADLAEILVAMHREYFRSGKETKEG